MLYGINGCRYHYPAKLELVSARTHTAVFEFKALRAVIDNHAVH